MKLGLFGVNMGPCSTPDTAARVARAAEEVGFESLWTGEHVVLPDPQVPPSPLPPDFPMLDPVVALAFLAGQTRTIRLGTGIIILPQRNPLVLAKELASLDVLSGGRLIFGVGIGYLRPEFDALGIPFEDKGPRTVEYLQVIRAIWQQAQPAYHGRHFAFGGVQARPRPAQQPHPPIVFGGMTPFAFRRAVRHGNGWYGFGADLERTQQCLAGLREAAKAVRRPVELGELEISVTPSVPLDLDTVGRFGDLGVHRLIPTPRRPSDRQLFPLALSEADVLDFVGRTGELVGRV